MGAWHEDIEKAVADLFEPPDMRRVERVLDDQHIQALHFNFLRGIGWSFVIDSSGKTLYFSVFGDGTTRSYDFTLQEAYALTTPELIHIMATVRQNGGVNPFAMENDPPQKFSRAPVNRRQWKDEVRDQITQATARTDCEVVGEDDEMYSLMIERDDLKRITFDVPHPGDILYVMGSDDTGHMRYQDSEILVSPYRISSAGARAIRRAMAWFLCDDPAPFMIEDNRPAIQHRTNRPDALIEAAGFKRVRPDLFELRLRDKTGRLFTIYLTPGTTKNSETVVRISKSGDRITKAQAFASLSEAIDFLQDYIDEHDLNLATDPPPELKPRARRLC